MKLEKLRKHRALLEKTEPIFRGNPVLSLGICLPFVIVPSMTLKNGVLLSFIMFIATIIPTAVYASLNKKTSREVRFIISVIISTSLVTAFYYFTRIQLSDFYILAGVYAVLFGINGLTTYCEIKTEGRGAGYASLFAFKACVGYSLVVIFISFIREFLALRTIWGHPVEVIPFKLEGIAFPFFGFIILGFLSAFFRVAERWVSRRLLAKSKKENKKREGEVNAG